MTFNCGICHTGECTHKHTQATGWCAEQLIGGCSDCSGFIGFQKTDVVTPEATPCVCSCHVEVNIMEYRTKLTELISKMANIRIPNVD